MGPGSDQCYEGEVLESLGERFSALVRKRFGKKCPLLSLLTLIVVIEGAILIAAGASFLRGAKRIAEKLAWSSCRINQTRNP